MPGSNVARHYVHLSGKDVIGALNARYGVKTVDPREKPAAPRTPSRCGRCKTMNPAGASYCSTCGGPLSLPAVKQIEEARSAEERLAELIRDPEAVEFLAKLLARGEGGRGRPSRRSDVAQPEPLDDRKRSSEERLLGSARSSIPQKVVPLTEAEDLIRAGYEFIAPLGSDRAILRAPSNP